VPGSRVTCPATTPGACRSLVCQPASGACLPAAAPDGTPCADADACTANDRCYGGVCLGEALDVPACGCESDADCAGFDDGDACNGRVRCLDGACALDPDSVPAPCPPPDDPCLTSLCDPADGQCAVTARDEGAACDEGDPCTVGDRCAAGSCKSGARNDCGWLGSDCTEGRCVAADGSCEAVSVRDGEPCASHDACAADARCSAGACVTLATRDCDDDDPCTADACGPGGDCTHALLDTGAPDPCDGRDDDCDGATDEDFVAQPTTCGVGACAAGGATSCDAGAVHDSCAPGTPSDETCDFVDDDCDGLTDEGFADCDGDGRPECLDIDADGDSECSENDCDDFNPKVNPFAEEVCNGIDDNCRNGIDEEGAGGCDTYYRDADGDTWGTDENKCLCVPTGDFSATRPGDCDDGAPGVHPEAPDARCDGVDDDCDGLTDEDYGRPAGRPYTPIVTTCGVGACAATGEATCLGGVELDSCVPGLPADHDTTCDGLDDDCNGAIDDGYVPQATACGIGACAATGLTACEAGVVIDSCAPGAPTDEACNGQDDDCDGAVDDGGDLCPLGEACVDGACACEPRCHGRQCGDDGCGGSCGACGVNDTCDAAGQCAWNGTTCSGVTCPTLPGYTLSCNAAGLCEYASVDAAGWKAFDQWIFVPGGTYEMGSPDTVPEHTTTEGPLQSVTLRGFLVQRTEFVTLAYEACEFAGSCTARAATNNPAAGWGVNTSADGRGDHPANALTWTQAVDACAWLGGRLPSEA